MSADSATTEPAVDPVSSQRIAGALREAILGGEFAPGERLRQDVIAERFGASRIPVREALPHPRDRGPHGGRRPTRARGCRRSTSTRCTPTTACASASSRSRSPRACPTSPRRRSTRWSGSRSRSRRTTTSRVFLVLDRDFHMTSYAACPSEQLLSATVRLWNSTQHYRRAFMLLAGPDRASIVNAEHRLLLDAIRRARRRGRRALPRGAHPPYSGGLAEPPRALHPHLADLVMEPRGRARGATAESGAGYGGPGDRGERPRAGSTSSATRRCGRSR